MADFGPCPCGGRLTLPSERDFGLCIYCRQKEFGSIYPEPQTSILAAKSIRRLVDRDA